MFAGEDSVGSRHEAHSLISFSESISTCRQSDDGSRHCYSCSCNSTDKDVNRYRLAKKTVRFAKAGSRTALTSFFSNGVPGIGTRALTGKDSGCSGMLKEYTYQHVVSWNKKGLTSLLHG